MWSVRLQDERGKPVIPKDAVVEFATIPEGVEFSWKLVWRNPERRVVYLRRAGTRRGHESLDQALAGVRSLATIAL